MKLNRYIGKQTYGKRAGGGVCGGLVGPFEFRLLFVDFLSKIGDSSILSVSRQELSSFHFHAG